MEDCLCSIVFLCLLGGNFGRKETHFTGFDLGFVKAMHESYCLQKPFCEPPKFQTIPPPILLDNGTIIMPDILPDRVSFLPNPTPPFLNDGSCCQNCSCDLDLCTQSGTCCPDLLGYLPSVDDSASKIKRVCQKASLKTSDKRGVPQGLYVWMFTKCPDNFKGDPGTKQRCENPNDFPGWDIIIPVVDKRRKATYYQNVYCAVCHNISKTNLVKFEASLECSESELFPSSMDILIDEVKARHDCNIVYNYPLNGDMESCEPAIKECNVTGHWKEFNPVTEAACHAYTAIYDNEYNNIFCFLCNARQPYNLPSFCLSISGRKGLPSFSALLKFTAPVEKSDSVDESKTKCTETQIYDRFSKMCLDLFCCPPKALKGGKCIDTVHYITGVAYEAFLKLVAKEIINTDNVPDIAEEVWEIYRIFLSELGVDYLVYERKMYYETMNKYETLVDCFVLHCKLYFTYYDRLSNVFVNTLLSLENEERLLTSKGNATFKMMLGYYEVSVGKDYLPELLNNIQTPLIAINDSTPPLDSTFPDIIQEARTTLVIKVLGCPAVKLRVHDPNATEAVDKDTEYPLGSFIEVNETGLSFVYVCAGDYINRARERYKKQATKQTLDQDAGLPQGILSLVCSCISIFCLILTLITYCLFHELRTQPGINNIALVICLIIAQALFQFGSDQSDNVPDWSCQMIGILIHFFWLLVMFWMNVCCIHMFLVFIVFIKITASNSTVKQTTVYSAYAVIASAVLVVINIVVSVANTEKNGIGYGGRICYIRDYHMVGYVFALPVGIILTFNLVCFIAVMIRMCRMPTVDSETRHTRNFLTIYAKLSTLTGITWVFGFVYFFTNVAVLEYIFIITNASQGGFLFLAFVCNKRVIGLYKSLLGRNRSPITGHLSTTRTKTINFTNMTFQRSGSK